MNIMTITAGAASVWGLNSSLSNHRPQIKRTLQGYKNLGSKPANFYSYNKANKHESNL